MTGLHNRAALAAHHAGRLEHVGFVGAAFADIAGSSHAVILGLAVWLAITGLVAVAGEWLGWA